MSKKGRLVERGIDPRLYAAWDNMRARCKPTHKAANDYASRGISVCARWEKFKNFSDDMGPHPGLGWTIDRVNNDVGYTKRNCRWATSKTQANNRRLARNAKLTDTNVRSIRSTVGVPLATLSKKFGVSVSHIVSVRNGTRRGGVR